MEFTRQVIDANPYPMYIKDKDGNLVIANAAYMALHRRSAASLLQDGRPVFDYASDRDLEIIATGSEVGFEEFYKLLDGSELWFYTVKSPFKSTDGSFYLLSVSSDITSLKSCIGTSDQAGAREASGGEMYRPDTTELRLLSTEANLYDYTNLGVLADDPVFVRKMQQLFIDTVPGLLDELKSACAAKEWSVLAHISHRLKSTFGNLNMLEPVEAMKEIEKTARTKQESGFERIPDLISITSDITEKVINIFKRNLQS
ncbi:Hpt domain-containing protein [Pontibacter sp. SGAir0037]|uniref:Hpt domain-containing protein n=1 Tax=Pontibacter sp. SGAir0037 TaxID=2571030 RepID=UPI0010CD2DB2|nr:Hpt domain-containing protein [Pontibacter sp. SGAir0037]QCR22507.1 hypothetical protein C1N53_09275 [Pontibacter sp. SGAir0037]